MLLFFRDDNLDLIYNPPIFSWKSIADKEFFGKLKLINWQAIFLSFITSYEGQKLNLFQTILAFHKYGLFLFLRQKYPSVRMVPNKEIDAVLHTHLTKFNQFEEDCKTLFNASLLHIPDFGKAGDIEKREWQLAFAQTKQLFELHFGQGSMGSSPAACCEILLSCM